MSCYYSDTIVAIATPPQNGAIGIIRLSGPNAIETLKNIFVLHKSKKPLANPEPHRFYFGRILSPVGELADQAMVVFFKAPFSFTGEDIVEIQCHGNQILLKRILNEILLLPQTHEIRESEPGEFTKRAFLNGKMDLTQAEAVHEIITASSDAGLKASLSNLDGRLKTLVDDLKAKLVSALALIEAGLEFSESEDIQTYQPQNLLTLSTAIEADLQSLLDAYQTSRLYDHGITVAIVGEPNVGKSSLLNALLVEDRAIVTEIAGTTRDVIEGARIIDGVRFVFKDTAGIRETADIIEKEGVRRSHEARHGADVVLEVADSRESCARLHSFGHHQKSTIRIFNKIDLLPGVIFDNQPSSAELLSLAGALKVDCCLSIKNRIGIHELITILKSKTLVHDSVQNIVHINERQKNKIAAASKYLCNFNMLIEKQRNCDDLLSEELRSAIYALDEVTGTVYNDDILSEIFSNFCVGK